MVSTVRIVRRRWRQITSETLVVKSFFTPYDLSQKTQYMINQLIEKVFCFKWKLI